MSTNNCKIDREKSFPVYYQIIALCLLFLFPAYIFGQDTDEWAFQQPQEAKGADKSLVDKIESDVIIPGASHEALWVHPEVVTIPGDPIICELRARETDRRGKDQHTTWHYFQSADFFASLQPIEEPEAPAWSRIGLSPAKIADSPKHGLKLPANINHTWASAYLHLGGDTVLQAFTTKDPEDGSYTVQSMALLKEKDHFRLLYLSNTWTNETGRGLYEPQIAVYKGNFYMTARAEDGHGYLLVSRDRGRSWEEPRPWTWDNGEEIPMNQTMTKLLAHSEGLVLVYTRIREDNEQTFRHRAPLHIADLDPVNLHLFKETERIVVPDQGLAVGNFWVWPVNEQESYVVTAEWPRDGRKENGDIWLVKVIWRSPNKLMKHR